MTRTLSAALTTEMGSMDRSPASQVTVERWLPDWTARISGLSAGETEQYAHGHSAAVAADGNGTGEDIICRARSGSYASPQDGILYVALVAGTDLETPANWDSLWVSTGITGLMYPAWTANSGAYHGGSIAVVHSGTDFRIFYLLATGALYCVDVSYAGVVGTPALIASLGTGVQLASMQLASCSIAEVFVLLNTQVEASLVSWQPAVYGFTIQRYYLSGTWQSDSSFASFQTRAEAALVRDDPDQGAGFGDTSATRLTAQWSKRFCGGLACNNVDANTVILSLGVTYWRRWGYDTHSQSIMTFIYYRNGWWEKGPEIDRVDFNEDTWLHLAVFARGFQIEGVNFLAWNRHNEPSDYEQSVSSQSLPRMDEVVFARFSEDGKYLTHFQYLGDPDDLTAASIVAVNHDGSKTLYALGWRSVFESPEAAFLCEVLEPQDLEDYAQGWSLTRNNRQGMTLDVKLADPSILVAAGSVVDSGALARAYYGIPAELVQIGQGYIDLNTPELEVDKDGSFSEGATLNCRADNLLINTNPEQVEEFIPLSSLTLDGDTDDHLTIERGVWTPTAMTWPELFFTGQYTDLNNQVALRLTSFPATNLNENGVASAALYGGRWTDAGNEWADRVSTWFKDICWVGQAGVSDEGMIEASVRFGNNSSQTTTYFRTNYKRQNTSNDESLYATVVKANGVVTTVSFSTYLSGPGGGPFYKFTGWDGSPYPQAMPQYAVMAGLICMAPETGKKYMFIWEHDSRFATSSHIHAPWNGESYDSVDFSGVTTASNMLYLVEFDYSGTSWIGRAVAGVSATGLTPGYPADLKMHVCGGTIYCYYRPHSTGTKNLWRFAMSYKAGRFSPGFGIVGRSHSPMTWRGLQYGITMLGNLINYVDFWDIKTSDCGRSQTVEDHLRRFCWRGFTEAAFDAKVDEASRVVASGSTYNYALPIENPTIDLKVSLPASTNEAGVFLRGVSVTTPTDECIRLGLVAHSTANSAGSAVNYYVVKRRYSGGAEVTTAREYSPIPIQLIPTASVPVRFSAQGAVYSVWIAGILMGTFTDTTPLGLYFGLYATGGSTTFTEIYVPELFELVGRVAQEAGQTVSEVIDSQIIGDRRVKAVFTYDGKLKFSYFSNHPDGPAFDDDQLWQSSIQCNGRYLSRVRVQGTDAYAVARSAVLAEQGERFKIVSNSAIVSREAAYREALAIITETAEQQQQATFEGAPDLRIEPEDVTTITVSRQSVAGDFIVDDVTIELEAGDNPKAAMKISTRQTVAL